MWPMGVFRFFSVSEFIDSWTLGFVVQLLLLVLRLKIVFESGAIIVCFCIKRNSSVAVAVLVW